MSEDVFDIGAGMFGRPGGGANDKKMYNSIFGVDAQHADLTALSDMAAAFSIHKERQKKADKVNFLRTILAGDSTEPIKPQLPSPDPAAKTETGVKALLGG